MLRYISKHLKLLWTGTELSFKFIAQYKVSFVFAALIILARITSIFLIWISLTNSFGQIANFKFAELILIGMFVNLGWSINEIFFGRFYHFSAAILRGELDNMLTKPVNSFWGYMVKNMEGISIVFASIELLALLITVIQYQMFSIDTFVIGVLFTVIGGLASGIFDIAIVSLSFWFGEISNVLELKFNVEHVYYRYPITILPLTMQIIFSTAIPLFFFGTAPALIVGGQYGYDKIGIMTAILLLVFALWTMVVVMLWKIGIRRYESGAG